MHNPAMNVFGDEWDDRNEQAGYEWRRLRLGRRLGASRLGASVYELPPGQRLWPYHFHHANEELLVVLEGEVIVRRPDGDAGLRTGESAVFHAGSDGAHAIRNGSAETARLLLVSTMIAPEIAQYPDSGKLGLFAGGAPGAPTDARTLERFVRDEPVGYWEDEQLT
jgi:uncharacterized cupin superfamily protein